MTIKDLSAYTGYSVGTISRVLNDQPNVSEKARTSILQAAAELGYRLNVNARQLRQQHSNCVLVMVKDNSSHLQTILLEAVRKSLAQTSHPPVVEYVEKDGNEVQRAAQLCAEKKPLGIVFLGGNLENFRKDLHLISLPCVLVGNDASGLKLPNLSSVSSDDAAAAQQAVGHLMALGHRNIAIIGDSTDAGHRRLRGCTEAFREHGVDFDPRRDYVSARHDFAGGYRAVGQLLKNQRKFSALFVMSDVVAIGAIRALQDAGMRVPEDVSVMGFDGLPLGSYTAPRLSTMRQNITELAQRGVQLLLESIENQTEHCFITVPAALEKRESTRQI